MKTNLQQMATDLSLTNLQIVGLHGIGWNIKGGNDDYFSYEDTLSEAEEKYLIAWLANEGIVVDKQNGVMLSGETARKWIAEHGKAEG